MKELQSSVAVPLSFKEVPEALLEGMLDGRADMFATLGTPRCCRFEYYVRFGTAPVDLRQAVPQAKLTANLSRRVCKADAPCTTA